MQKNNKKLLVHVTYKRAREYFTEEVTAEQRGLNKESMKRSGRGPEECRSGDVSRGQIKGERSMMTKTKQTTKKPVWILE